jgi:delta-lactam-biosynthetic de-N-acetylase
MHHRRGITALILLVIISGVYLYFHLHKPQIIEPVVIQVPFNGKVPSEISHGDTTKKQIIFTFDAGEGTQSASSTLEILRRHHVKATFFITGKWVSRNKNFIHRMRAEGHDIFNHTFSHPHLTELTDPEIIKELNNTDSEMMDVTGSSTKPFFRPPYGDRDDHVLAIAAKQGFRSVYWTVDAHDWMENDGITKEEVKSRILDNASPGAIILMHLGDSITENVLDDTLTSLEQRGYRMVSLTQGL